MKLKSMYRKGQALGGLTAAAIGLVVLVVVVSVGADVVDKLQDTQTINSSAFNTTEQGLRAMLDFSDWFTVIVVIVAASFIIILLLRAFGRVQSAA